MSAQMINIQLPSEIYQRLKRVATATNQPLEAVLVQTLRGNLPPSIDDISPDLRHLVIDLQPLSDETLWEIVKAPLPATQWRRHERLLRKAQKESLTVAEQSELSSDRTAADQYVTRRSYALALLKWRGYTIPAKL